MSDLARQYVPGQEPAKGGQMGGQSYPAGKELASSVNGDKAHDYKDDRAR
jgi:hypothetical protein